MFGSNQLQRHPRTSNSSPPTAGRRAGRDRLRRAAGRTATSKSGRRCTCHLGACGRRSRACGGEPRARTEQPDWIELVASLRQNLNGAARGRPTAPAPRRGRWSGNRDRNRKRRSRRRTSGGSSIRNNAASRRCSRSWKRLQRKGWRLRRTFLPRREQAGDRQRHEWNVAEELDPPPQVDAGGRCVSAGTTAIDITNRMSARKSRQRSAHRTGMRRHCESRMRTADTRKTADQQRRRRNVSPDRSQPSACHPRTPRRRAAWRRPARAVSPSTRRRARPARSRTGRR